MALEDILKKIERKNQKDIKHIKRDASKKCDEIKKGVEREVKELKEKNKNDAKVKATSLREHMLQEARLKMAKEILETKSDILDEVFKEALKKLENLSPQEYLSWIGKILLKVAEPGEAEMILSIEDKKRYDIGELLKRVNKRLKGLRPYTRFYRIGDSENGVVDPEGKSYIKLSNETRDIGGGFILKRPRKEINCSFKSLLEEKSNNLRIKISQLLF